MLRVVLRFTLAREAKVCLCCFVTGEFRLLQHSLPCSLSYGTIDQDYTIAITSSLSPVCLKVVMDRQGHSKGRRRQHLFTLLWCTTFIHTFCTIFTFSLSIPYHLHTLSVPTVNMSLLRLLVTQR